MCRFKLSGKLRIKDNSLEGVITAPPGTNGLYTQSGRFQFDNSFGADLIFNKMMIGSSIYRFNESCTSQGLQLNYSTFNYLLHYKKLFKFFLNEI